MNLAILTLTKGGGRLAKRLAPILDGEIINHGDKGISAVVQELWPRYEKFIFIMATGIAVRTIAPLLRDKKTDPGVVVMDEAGTYAISLLSGHLGGANELAREVARISGGQAVITTASDTLDLTPIDLWARFNNLILTQGSFTTVSAKLVNSGKVKIWLDDGEGQLPDDFHQAASPEEADLIISNKLQPQNKGAVLCPKNLILGIGCNRGTSAKQIETAVTEACLKNNLECLAIYGLASIDLKSDETGLLDFGKQHNLPINFYPANQLNKITNISHSETVFKATGAYGVAEPAAMIMAGTDKLLHGKMKWKDVTIAIAETTFKLTANYQ